MKRPPLSRRSHGFTLVELLATIAIIGLLIALLLPSVQAARAAARRMQCANNVRQLAIAFSNYAAQNGVFPPFARTWDHAEYMSLTGGPGSWFDDHGWFSQMGPYIDQMAWHNTIDFQKSFSDAVNYQPRQAKISLYGCPDDGLKQNEWGSATWTRVRGNYVVNAGNTIYGQADYNGVKFLGAPFGPRRSKGPAGVRDGMSNTLMVAEVITITTSVGWGGPISDIMTALGGNTFNSWLPPNSSVPDFSPRWCPQPGDYNGIPGCIYTTEDGKLGQFAARSKHFGGVNVALCDGSVRFVSDTVDLLSVWRPLSTAAGADIPGSE